MPHDHVTQCEIGSRTKGQMADNEPHCRGEAVRHSAMTTAHSALPSSRLALQQALPGVPLCSWTTKRSVTPLALQALTSAPTSCRPRFMRWAPGNTSFSSCPRTNTKLELGPLGLGIPYFLPPSTFANIFRRELGSLEVVIMTLGSSTPAHRYSSSTWLVTPVRRTKRQEKCCLCSRSTVETHL